MEPATKRRVFLPLACFLVAYLSCVVAPLRPQTSDTTPGFLSAVVLACSGDHDLSRVPWVANVSRTEAVPYWVAITPDHQHLVSTFGPAPAWLGRPALIGLSPGQVVEEPAVRARLRHAAAVAIGVTAAAACVAAMAFVEGWLAALIALVGAASFAGAPSLGQALWQQTAALPLLLAGCAAALWSERSRGAALVAPALLAAALWTRPVEAPIGLALGIVWLRAVRGGPRRLWLLAALLAVIASVPFVAWNLENLGTLLPSGQWVRNQAMSERVFDLSPGHLVSALAGLLVSPARGLVVFAPVALIVPALAVRDARVRPLAIGLFAQLFVAAAFFRWWGGVSFGPRLLAATTWIALVLVPAIWSSRLRHVVLVATALTGFVGLVGTFGWDPAQWEMPAQVDQHPEKLWQVRDTPLLWLFTPPRWQNARKVGPGKTIFCPHGRAGRFALGSTAD